MGRHVHIHVLDNNGFVGAEAGRWAPAGKDPRTEPLTELPRASYEELSKLRGGKRSLRTVPLNTVKATQEKFSPSAVTRYQSDLTHGRRLEHPVAVHKNGVHYLEDGHHRVIAAKRAGLHEMTMNVLESN